MTSTVRAASLYNFVEVASRLGLEANAMLRRVGIDRRALNDPDVRLPSAAVAELLEASATLSGCETVGLQMAESRRLSDFGAVSLLITHQPTIRDVLMTIVHYRMLLNESLVVHVEEHGDLVIVRQELLMGADAPLRQAYELATGVIYRVFRSMLGARWRAQSVNFTHAPPRDLTAHRRLFGPIVEFNSDFNGLTCLRADLDAPNPAADPALAEFAERYVRTLPNAERRSIAAEVRKAIYLLLPSGDASIGRVSVSLGLNERTLQRRLSGEGADFSGLLNGVRRELTMRYVANPDLPLARVAGMVGFARQSSFSRWFADEFGCSATERRALTRPSRPG
jgi:AraC-like DNA-binding protein